MWLDEWYTTMPVVTRAYMTAVVLTTLAVHLEIVNILLLYLNFDLAWKRAELWRLFTNFLYFGQFGLGFFFHLTFMVRHSTLLEESSFRGRTGGFVWLFLWCASGLLLVDLFCWWLSIAATPMFLGPSLAMAIVYVWARRNPHMRMNLLGFLTFNAPWLPWVIIGLESALGQTVNWFDVVGVAVGHTYYFFADVYPTLTNRNLVRTPALLHAAFDAAQ